MEGYAHATRRPLSTIIFDPSEDWSDLRNAVLEEIADNATTVRTRVRTGMVLATSGYVSNLTFGPHEPGEGRRLERYSRGSQALIEIERDRHLQGALTCIPGMPRRAAPLGLRIIWSEALTFTDLEPNLLSRLIKLPVVVRNLVAHGQVQTDDHVAYELFWRHLVPTAIVTDGVIIDRLEDSPEFSSDPEPTLIRTVEPEIGQGVFYEWGGLVYVDDAVAHCVIPPPPAEPLPADKRTESPIGRALASIGISTGARISARDDASSNAIVDRSEAFYECPDVNAVEYKVKNFLLSRTHEKQRWVDLADHGYVDRASGALVLASALSSALYDAFPVLDARPTADRALQFTVPILLPLSPWGRRLALTTSWTYRAGELNTADLVDKGGNGPATTGLWLGTAYVDRRCDEYAEPVFSPFNAKSRDWSGLAEFVEARGLQAFIKGRSTIKSAGGWLLVPHTCERNASFASWVRRNRGGQVYQRNRLGGRVTAFRPATLQGLGCATGTAYALRLIQSLLGMAAIRSFVDMHYD